MGLCGSPKKRKAPAGSHHQRQVMSLAALSVSALEALQKKPDTLVITLPDGVRLNYTMTELKDALHAAKFMAQADQCSKCNKFPDAEKLYRRALEINPLDPVLVMSLGNTLCLTGRIDEGLGCLKKAVDLCPHNYREKARVLNCYHGAKEYFKNRNDISSQPRNQKPAGEEGFVIEAFRPTKIYFNRFTAVEETTPFGTMTYHFIAAKSKEEARKIREQKFPSQAAIQNYSYYEARTPDNYIVGRDKLGDYEK